MANTLAPLPAPTQDLTHADGPLMHSLLWQDIALRGVSPLEALMADAGVAAVLEASAR